MLTKDTKFILALLLQIAVLFLIIIFKFSVVTGGTDVYLRIAPVDPRDPLRGDYVTFNYDISRLPSYDFDYSPIKNGDQVYVPLIERGKYWDKDYTHKVTKTLPSVVPGGVKYIKARVSNGERDEFGIDQSWNAQEIGLTYNIEQYFIPEGTGRNVSFWNREAAALIKVDSQGNAAINSIYIDGKKWPN